MGFKVERRPILSLGGIAVGSMGSASTTPQSVAGDIDVADAVRGLSATLTGALALPTETVTLAAGDQTISRNGISFITLGTSGSGRDAVLQAPSAIGQVKHVFLINNTTSVDCAIHTNATANVFYATTYNTATVSAASTGSPGGTPGGSPYLGLYAVSTSQWALIAGTTFNWDLSASTGSTSIA